MTSSLSFLLIALALLVGVVAAVRSTWSPCGLSMLSTITPIGERAKGHRYRATATWFIVGAATGGLALGAVAAVLAVLVRVGSATNAVVGVMAVVATSTALVSDTGLAGFRIPVHHRQVNERWLDAYRPWVYGAGFGFQIGCGVATYITTTTVYLVVVLAGLTGRPLAALGVGLVFGLVRGAGRDPDVAHHHAVRTPVLPPAVRRPAPVGGPGGGASLVVTTAALVVAVGPVAALWCIGAVAVVSMAVRVVWHLRRVGTGAADAVAGTAGSGGGVDRSIGHRRGPAADRPQGPTPGRSVPVG